MVEYRAEPLDDVFHALADPTRRAMLRALAEGERNIGELSAPFGMTLAGASKHVKVLEAAGLLRRRIEGRVHFCEIRAEPLAAADSWIRFYESFWVDRLEALDAVLRSQTDGAAFRGDTGKESR
jgi:DNA-binding transcriptional ArsR family regulator